MPNTREIMELQRLAGMEKFSKRTIAEELERQKLIELLSQVQYLGGLEEKVADHLIAHGVTVQEWISVTDRLPSDRGDVLVCAWWHEKWQTKIGWYNDVAKTFHILTTEEGDLPWWYVTHWMPLPDPPKGE